MAHRHDRHVLPVAATLFAAVLATAAQGAKEGESLGAVRVAEQDKVVALEIATRRFTREEKGPDVVLVGVAHVADMEFYRKLQKRLDASDIVLYESVMPAGAGGPGGESDVERVTSTRAGMSYVAGLLELHKLRRDRYPESVDELGDFVSDEDPRLAEWLQRARVDAWGRTLGYLQLDAGAGFSLTCLGTDGSPGGDGHAADLVLSHDDQVEALLLGSEGNIQAELADALGLAFQLEAIDYGRANWRCSDMAMDELQRALDDRGLEIEVLSEALGGGTLPAKVIKLLLRAIRFLDAIADGAIADTVKVVLIEMIGDENLVNQGLDQMGAGFTEVIVDERNQVVIDDLKRVIAEEPDAGEVAIFYGAAHMADFAERLSDQLGYEPAEVEWYRAIEVDMTTSAVDPVQLYQMRTMVRRMMKEMGK